MKKHLIYKRDKWNMLTVEVQGRTLVVREISDQWGEECHTFVSRPEMMDWANRRFQKSEFVHNEDEYNQIMQALKEI